MAFLMRVPHSGRVFFSLYPTPHPPNLASKKFCPPANIPPGTLREKKTLLIATLSCLHPPPGVQEKPELLVLALSPVHRRVVLRPCWES